IGLIISTSQAYAVLFGIKWEITFQESLPTGMTVFYPCLGAVLACFLPYFIFLSTKHITKKALLLGIAGNFIIVMLIILILYATQQAEQAGLLFGVEFLVLTTVPISNALIVAMLWRRT